MSTETTSSSYRIAARTDVGRVRDHNEDNFIIAKDIAAQQWFFDNQAAPTGSGGTLLVVADGMGGTNAGEVASQIAVESMRQLFGTRPESLPTEHAQRLKFTEGAILEAHNRILAHARSNKDTAGMGTTCVLAWIVDNKAYVAWSGDSRCYLLENGGAMRLVSQDHSMVWELVKAGTLTPEEARKHPDSNIITQCLGDMAHPPEPESVMLSLKTGDRLLLCSDGLSGEVPDTLIESYLKETEDPAEACSRLIQSANDAGGKDNITVILLHAEHVPAGADAAVLSPEEIAPERPNSNTAHTGMLNTRETKGSSAKMYLLILVLVALVAGAGWWFYSLSGRANEGDQRVPESPVDSTNSMVPHTPAEDAAEGKTSGENARPSPEMMKASEKLSPALSRSYARLVEAHSRLKLHERMDEVKNRLRPDDRSQLTDSVRALGSIFYSYTVTYEAINREIGQAKTVNSASLEKKINEAMRLQESFMRMLAYVHQQLDARTPSGLQKLPPKITPGSEKSSGSAPPGVKDNHDATPPPGE